MPKECWQLKKGPTPCFTKKGGVPCSNPTYLVQESIDRYLSNKRRKGSKRIDPGLIALLLHSVCRISSLSSDNAEYRNKNKMN